MDFLERIPGNLLGYQTVLADPALLTDQSALFRAASILAETDCSAYYIIFLTDSPPRIELADSFELLGGMRFIRELKSTGRRIVVAFCSSDVIMYKSAGADSCA